MPEDNFQDKTEPATPKKKEEARKKGEVAKSRELSTVAVLFAGAIYLFFAGKHLVLDLGNQIRGFISDIPQFRTNHFDFLGILRMTAENFLWLIIPMMMVLCMVAILANFLQTGFIWSVEPLAPSPSKIDPIKGTKKIFSKRTLVELAKSVAKLVIVGWAAISTMKDDFSHFVPLIYQEKIQIMSVLAQTSMKMVIRCCWVIAILAILDFLYQKWEFEQKLKMTKQEVKDEFKQTEGDPLVKSRIKSIQREMARRRMMEEVPKADVVITNPVHLAIALRYKAGEMNAPVIVAKGAERVAFKIRDVAMVHQIPVVENRKLAQNLYKLDMGEEIPSHLYQAVAEILAYVYRIKNATEGY